jgi:hypothetical protein
MKLFRHGNRTPSPPNKPYPKDPYLNETYFPFGRGQLTNVNTNTVESGYSELEKCMKTGSLYPRFTKNENKIYHVDYRFNVQLVAKKTGKEFFSNVNLVLSIYQLNV